MNRIEEQYLLAQVRQKNAAAAERLIDAHYQDAYRFAFCFCRSQCVAEDITQEAFVRVWQHLEKFNGLCRFKTWLFRIIYALFIDDQRRQRRAPFTVMPNDEPASPDHDMLDEIALQTIWQRLPEEQQQILSLHYIDDLRYREIALVLQIPIGTVKSRLYGAVNNLRTQISEMKKL